MMKLTAGKWLGTAAITAGLLWAGLLSFYPRTDVLSGRIRIGDLFNAIGLMWIFMIPAFFSLYFGTRLVLETTREHIKGAAGSLMTVIAFAAYAVSLFLYLPGRHEVWLLWALILALTLTAAILHALICRAVVRREGIPTLGYREYINRGVLFLAALMVFQIGVEFVQKIGPRDSVYPSLTAEPWMSGGFFGSIFLAWAFYRVTVWLVQRGSPVSPGAVQLRGPWQKS